MQSAIQEIMLQRQSSSPQSIQTAPVNGGSHSNQHSLPLASGSPGKTETFGRVLNGMQIMNETSSYIIHQQAQPQVFPPRQRINFGQKGEIVQNIDI